MTDGARRCGILAGAVAAYGIACRLSPAFARFALGRVSLPVMAWLHRLTAALPFPAAEAGAVALAGALGFALTAGAARSLVHRDLRPLAQSLTDAARAALILATALIALWEPARALPSEAPPEPEEAQLEWLCEALIAELNASPLLFPEPEEALRLAPEAAGMAGRAVKAARYPEWMDAAHIWGLFVPLTGEALANASEPGPLLPFTAVHELTHLTGVADEGAANVAAWERCMAYGGAFADSARLWALRYALGLLQTRDWDACRRAAQKMEAALQRVFHQCGGEIAPAKTGFALPVLSPCTGDYSDLARYLAKGYSNSRT